MAKINSKQKGNRGELECVKILQSYFGEGFSRTPQSGAWGGGQNRQLRENMSLEQKITLVADIMTPPEFNFVIEHKNYEKIELWDLFNSSSNLFSWTEQVFGDADFVGKDPLLIMKFNRKQRIAMVTKKPKKYRFIFIDKKGTNWYCDWFENMLNENEQSFWISL